MKVSIRAPACGDSEQIVDKKKGPNGRWAAGWMMSHVYVLGVQAYWDGDGIGANPYDKTEARYYDWEDGYFDTEYADLEMMWIC